MRICSSIPCCWIIKYLCHKYKWIWRILLFHYIDCSSHSCCNFTSLSSLSPSFITMLVSTSLSWSSTNLTCYPATCTIFIISTSYIRYTNSSSNNQFVLSSPRTTMSTTTTPQPSRPWPCPHLPPSVAIPSSLSFSIASVGTSILSSWAQMVAGICLPFLLSKPVAVAVSWNFSWLQTRWHYILQEIYCLLFISPPPPLFNMCDILNSSFRGFDMSFDVFTGKGVIFLLSLLKY